MTNSDANLKKFLEENKQNGANIESYSLCHGDMSTRKYYRVEFSNGTSSILMHSPPDNHPQSLPGHKISDYLRIGRKLFEADVSVPEIYAADEKQGFILMEDFGSHTMADHIKDKPSLYKLAANALDGLKNVHVEGLMNYRDSHVHQGRRRVIDWYMPVVNRKSNDDGVVEEYLAVWDQIESNFDELPNAFLHIDYFPANLVYLPERKGGRQCGILDFQGAMMGAAPYDLANLLEDARYLVPEKIRHDILEEYSEQQDNPELFKIWYRILGTQYHCRVIGQFLKLAIALDRPEYLQYIPVVHQHLVRGLEDPILALMKEFLSQHFSLHKVPEIDVQKAKQYIRYDAF